MDHFYMVYVEAGKSPERQHPNKCEAIAEAGRLFNIMKKRAYVLEVVGYHDSTGSAYHESIGTIKEGAL